MTCRVRILKCRHAILFIFLLSAPSLSKTYSESKRSDRSKSRHKRHPNPNIGDGQDNIFVTYTDSPSSAPLETFKPSRAFVAATSRPSTSSPITISSVSTSPVSGTSTPVAPTTFLPVTTAPVSVAPVSAPTTPAPSAMLPNSSAQNSVAPTFGSESPSVIPRTPAPSSFHSQPYQQYCIIGSTGNFGLESGNLTVVIFFYEMEVIPGVKSTETKSYLIQLLEQAIVESILPDLFSAQCSERMRRRILALTGISIRPSDSILNGVECNIKSENCFVINGSMTLFGDDDGITAEKTRDQVKLKIEDGTFAKGIDDRIANVSWHSYLQFKDSASPQQQSANNRSNDVSKVPAYAWVLICIGSVLMLLAFCACPNPFGSQQRDEHCPTKSRRGSFPKLDNHESLLVSASEYDTFKLNPGDSQAGAHQQGSAHSIS